jgi:two-component system phosphate regulon sensor histidine kinase PhoR
MPKPDLILLAMESSPTLDLLERALRSARYGVVSIQSASGLKKSLQELSPALLLIAEKLGEDNGMDLALYALERFPTLPVIFYATCFNPEQMLQVLRAGLSDYINPPLRIDDIVQAIQRSQKHARQMGDWVRREVRRSTESLEARVNEMDILLNLSQAITASLEIDGVLTRVVTAAVELTGAEEGLLLLQDEHTQDLYMRAGRNIDDDFARTLRLPVHDSLAGQVMETGKPISFCQDSPNKIKTAYLVYSLIYVPIFINGRVTGVMGVDNRSANRPFSQRHELLMQILADYAAIAIQNAQLYQESEHERAKFGTTITNLQNSVILLNNENQIVLINPAAKKTFGLEDREYTNIPVLETIHNSYFESGLKAHKENGSLDYYEVYFEDGRIFNMQHTPIPEIGAVITLEDITHLKRLDQMKSDFIHTVSHDLRSPLTTILGYIELLDRVGPLNDQQKNFVNHIQNSTNIITAMVNDLLDLGRIEAGFDSRNDDVALGTLLRYTLDNLDQQIKEKQLDIKVNIAPDLPILQGNPIRLRQVIDNLLVNAIKYTPAKGKIKVGLRTTDGQLIFEVADTGIGITASDQANVFKKFFRAENAPAQAAGTGLGLAIVKSIVENHSGRIWVESVLGRGSKFTVILPAN